MITKISNRIQQVILTQVVAAMLTPIKDLAAYKLGLINANGDLIRNPKTKQEHAAFSKTVAFGLAVRKYTETAKVMRGEQKQVFKRDHTLRSVYAAAEEDAQLTESTITYLDILTELTNDHAPVEQQQVSNRFTMLDPLKRRGYMKQLFGTGER